MLIVCCLSVVMLRAQHTRAAAARTYAPCLLYARDARRRALCHAITLRAWLPVTSMLPRRLCLPRFGFHVMLIC